MELATAYGVSAGAGGAALQLDQFGRGRRGRNSDAVRAAPLFCSGPSGTVRSQSASFGLRSTQSGSRFECRRDSPSSWSECRSPQSYANLGQGPHTFEVRAIDQAGNVDETPAKRSWTVDTVGPTLKSVSPRAGATGVSTAANVLATFSEPMRRSTRTMRSVKLVRRGSSRAVAATVTYDAARRRVTLDPKSALARGGTYTATVTTGATDSAGNALKASKSWSFTVRR